MLLEEGHGQRLHLQQRFVLAVVHVHDLQDVSLPVLSLQTEVLVKVAGPVGDLGHTLSIQLLHLLGGCCRLSVGLE